MIEAIFHLITAGSALAAGLSLRRAMLGMQQVETTAGARLLSSRLSTKRDIRRASMALFGVATCEIVLAMVNL